MSSRLRRILVFGTLAVYVCWAKPSASPDRDEQIPRLDQRVSDFTNTLSFGEWNFLENRLKRFEDSTSTQIAVLIVGSLNGLSIEEYANKVFELNKIGQSKKNNGVLLIVVKDQRAIRIEAGYGLEGVLTDAIASQIINKEIVPRFREGKFYAGVLAGVSAIMEATAGEYRARGKAAPAISGGLVLLFLMFFFFVFLPMVASRRRYVLGSGGIHYYPGWGYGRGSWRGTLIGSGSVFGGGGGWSGGGGFSGGGGASGRW